MWKLSPETQTHMNSEGIWAQGSNKNMTSSSYSGRRCSAHECGNGKYVEPFNKEEASLHVGKSGVQAFDNRMKIQKLTNLEAIRIYANRLKGKSI